jgi:acyl-CoA reductase-like NAD-dependent aldehyde dehydrogenase
MARVEVAKTYKLYIDGKFPRTESGRYHALHDTAGALLANVCLASRKDFREAVVAARKAFSGWSAASAYLRGQILYRIAEMLEGRSTQFTAELCRQGARRAAARRDVTASIDRLVHYAGWSDKYPQLLSSVNPVATAHFNFSVPEPVGVVGVLAPSSGGLLGLVSNLAPVIVGGNTCALLAPLDGALAAMSFAEVLHASDLPPGVVNVLTGDAGELGPHFASHMDVNALVYCDADASTARTLEQAAAGNLKRVCSRTGIDWSQAGSQNPYLIRDTQEIKTTWHPVGW